MLLTKLTLNYPTQTHDIHSLSKILLCTRLASRKSITLHSISAIDKSILSMHLQKWHRATEKHLPIPNLRLQKRTKWSVKRRETARGKNQFQLSRTSKWKTALTPSWFYSSPYVLASAMNFSEQERVFPNISQQLQPCPRGSKLLLILGSRETGYMKDRWLQEESNFTA